MNTGVIVSYGDPQIDMQFATTNAWQTLAEALGVPLIHNGQDPVGVLISIKDTTNDALFNFGGTAEHPLTSSTTNPASAFFGGGAACKNLKLKSAVAGSAATVSVTVFY